MLFLSLSFLSFFCEEFRRREAPERERKTHPGTEARPETRAICSLKWRFCSRRSGTISYIAKNIGETGGWSMKRHYKDLGLCARCTLLRQFADWYHLSIQAWPPPGPLEVNPPERATGVCKARQKKKKWKTLERSRKEEVRISNVRHSLGTAGALALHRMSHVQSHVFPATTKASDNGFR